MNSRVIIFTLLLFVAFIVISVSALFSAKKMTTTAYSNSDNPDFFMTNAISARFNHEGIIQNKVIINRMTRFTTAVPTSYLVVDKKLPIYSNDIVNTNTGFKTIISFLARAFRVKFDQQRQINYKTYSDTITNFGNEGIYFLEKPQITIYNSQEEPCRITANYGRSDGDNKIIHLMENVRVIQNSGSNNSNLDVTTASLDFYPETKSAETTELVTVIQNGNISKAIGAKIDLKNGKVEFVSKFKGVFKI
ncbi:MAG: LPS export ABC transporter periplasmic protein LptC [Coxiellaceae bacterium]|jgi:LPS export ABC transporter protein LptC|nr:LPS export ABC transporter periplasmic protein LptC [Coxiellaceae bacterium]